MRLVPGADRVVRHICIRCISRFFEVSNTRCYYTSWLSNVFRLEEIVSRSKLTEASSTLRRRNLNTELFLSENASNLFRPDYAEGIRKRNNPRSFWICVWDKIGHVIIVMPTFFVFKMFSVHTKTKSRFQIHPVSCAFPKSSVFLTD